MAGKQRPGRPFKLSMYAKKQPFSSRTDYRRTSVHAKFEIKIFILAARNEHIVSQIISAGNLSSKVVPLIAGT